MAAVGGNRAERFGNSNLSKSALASPEKVRELLNEGVAPCEATNKEAFFSRVESYSCLKWAGKPRSLSPLICARYGWINVGCDMLKCSSCQAFLSATLQPTLDFEKESRVAEISKQLQTRHEKFCPWPDFPCPRIWVVPACEPSALLASFLERFHSTCFLAQQLPALKPEQLKSMSLTEDVVSVILQLIEEEQKRKGESSCSEPLAIQVAACIVALCGWAAPSQCTMNLPILTCAYCKRKVGLWNFHQMEEAAGDVENVPNSVSTSGPGTTSPAPVPHEGQGDGPFPATTPTTPTTPCRMKLRSQDTTRLDQDDLLKKTVFDPLAQHRDWCPWVAVGKENVDPSSIPILDSGSSYQQGWKAALDLLIPLKKNDNATGSSPAQARDKSKRVFAIFRQWQVTSQS
uniref:Uncharacterized protein n=1 Tax=Periophthalmus magnuspinnatus TaxID=409849 RepID=A0A3B3ZHZ6_9GOBI